ncbi:hypothetical protein C2S51_019919 [Perilla frutescens var. frutescens]|nr:hypothetical protein C2S51_019919 [Perilla frutescens var. frutescens]
MPLLLISTVRLALREVDFMNFDRGSMHNTVADLITLKALKVRHQAAPPRQMITVLWKPSPPGWIKINMDGSSLGCPGKMTTGGVFKRSDGAVSCCFHTEEGVGFAFLAKLAAVIVALE